MQRVQIDQDKLDAWRSLVTANSRLFDRLGADLEREFDLPLAWYEVLLLLSESQGELRMHELADSRLLSRSAATRLVERMEKAGLVGRSMCPEDRRGTVVSFTDAGRELFTKAGRLHLAGIERWFARFIDGAEAEVLRTVCERLLAGLAESSEPVQSPTR